MDWIQLLTSLIAIVLLAIAAEKMFPVPSTLNSERILKNYLRYAPTANPAPPIISLDHKASIVPMLDNSLEFGLVTQLGDRVVCRTITAGTAIKWTFSANHLSLDHSDYTQPVFSMQLSDEDLETLKKIFIEFEGQSHAA